MTTTLKNGDIVKPIDTAAPSAYTTAGELAAAREHGAVVIRATPDDVGDIKLQPLGDNFYHFWLKPHEVTLIEEPTPEPAPAVTDEQRAAWLRLSNSPDAPAHLGWVEADAALIAPLLPSELTNPQPVLPDALWTAWSDTNGDLWVVDGVGKLYCPSDRGMRAEDYAPFRPLLPERPKIGRQQVEAAVEASLDVYAPNAEAIIDAVLALVNGDRS
jgi:hypothetical protein